MLYTDRLNAFLYLTGGLFIRASSYVYTSAARSVINRFNKRMIKGEDKETESW